MESQFSSVSPRCTTKTGINHWILCHRKLIIPLLGDNKIRDELEIAEDTHAVQAYEILPEKPLGIRADLKPHQIEGVSFLNYWRCNKAHGILGDEMGLGKTLQVLSFFQQLVNVEVNDKRSFLVVCPLSVLSTWMSETEKWTTLRAIQYYGSQEKRKEVAKVISKKGIDLVITTYETLVSDSHRLSRLGIWKAVVLDEGHKIRNDTKKGSAALSRLKTDQRVILTGTPIHNNLVETCAILKWLYPDVFGGKETSLLFKKAFSLGEGKIDAEFIQHVRKFLEVIMLRRTKDLGVNLNLPPKIEVVLYVPLTELQRSLYLGVVHGNGLTALSSFNMTPPSTPTSVNGFDGNSSPPRSPYRTTLNPLMELRKICTHPLLLNNFPEDLDLDMTLISSKFIILQKLLQQVIFKEQKKILIFSGFDGGLDTCEYLLEGLDIQFLRLDGTTSAAVRKYNIHLFNKKARFKVFLVATKAGGEGVTLTAAEVVVFLDLDWNPQVIRQAEARAHRIGQTRPVTVYKICTRGTVESQMISRLNKKLYLDAKVNNQFVNQTSLPRTSFDELEPALTDTEVIRNLIRTSVKSVAVEQMSADQMINWSFEKILDYCAVTEFIGNDEEDSNTLATPSSPQECFNDEKSWLAKSERIKTDFFHGIRLPRSPTTPTRQFHETKGKRIVKTRVVFNREYGFHVSKESMLCGEWEAVPTLAGKDPSLADYKAPPKSRFTHEKICLFCSRSRRLTDCLYCPRAYHEKCASKKKSGKFAYNACPYHQCVKCLQTAPEAGGLLFNCSMCPRAFCVECVNLDTMVSLADELPKFQALGFDQPKHMKHIVCGSCTDRARGLKRSVGGGREMTSNKRRLVKSY